MTKVFYSGVIKSGYYAGSSVELKEMFDLGDLGVWFYTDDIPNYPCQSYDLWFKETEIDFQ